MKKMLLFIGMSLMVASNTFAQCNKLKEETDDFTGQTVRKAKVNVGNLLTKWSVEVEESEGKASMKWGIAMQGEFNQIFEKGTPMLLKLDDGTVVKVLTREPSSPVTKAVAGGGAVSIFSIYYLAFDLSKKTLQQLSNSRIENIRIDVPGQEIKNAKIKKGQTSTLQDLFTCLLNG